MSIATYLNRQNHTARIVDNVIKKNNYRKILSAFKPDVVGISVISNKSITDAVEVSKAARAKHIPVVWGGPFASVIPETVLQHGCVDYVIIGEGEITWEALLAALKDKSALNNIDGLAYTQDGKIHINKDRAFADLADFPVLDWSLVTPSDYFQQMFTAERMLYLYSAKGCPGQCTFCYNKSFNKCVYRKRPFDYCIEEMKYLAAKCSMDGVHFADELWCRNKKEMTENCEKLMNTGLNILWGCNARIGTFDKEDFMYLYRAGCRWIFFGVESGSESLQAGIHKGIALEKVEETVNDCAEAGIVPVTSFIIGFPDETPEQIKETIGLAQRIPKAMYDFNFFFPLAGSELCNILISQGRYKPPDTLEGLSKLLPTEKIHNNFSKLPEKELRVIRAFFMWSSLTRKDFSFGSGNYISIKKVIADSVKWLSRSGAKDFFVSLLYDTQTLWGVVAGLVFHPSIRKKYGLYKGGK